MERDLDVDERVGGGVGVLGGEADGGRAIADDEPFDEAHHVERRAVQVDVGAVCDAGRHGHCSALERGHDAPLAMHVVGGGECVADGGTAQRPHVLGRVGDSEGEVGPSGGDEVIAERSGGARNVLDEPGVDTHPVDATRGLRRRVVHETPA